MQASSQQVPDRHEDRDRLVNRSTAAVKPPEIVADRTRRALAINLGANIVRRELKLPEVEIPAADPRFTFAG